MRRLLSLSVVVVTVVGVFAGSAGTAAAAPPSEPGRVLWRTKVPLDFFTHTPGVGPDGTVYIPVRGGTQAVAPDGTFTWLAPAGGSGSPVSTLADGTVIVAGAGPGAVGGTDAISAIRPDGSIGWTFTGAQDYLLMGPSVGPDGNIYAVSDWLGIGFFSLTPTGQLRFATGRFAEYGAAGGRIAFGPDRAYFGFDMYGVQQPTFVAYDLNGNRRWTLSPQGGGGADVGPNGNVVFGTFPTGTGLSIASYTRDGAKVYSFYEFPGNTQEPVDVGPDNVAYTVRNLATLYAINPNGSVRFKYADDGIMFEPVLRPQADLLFMGGRVTYGEPGFLRAVSTAGQGLWQVDLPTEAGFGDYGQLVPSSRPVFSPDGKVAYVVVDVAGDGNVPYSETYAYLYAIDVGGATPPPSGGGTLAAPSGLTATSPRKATARLGWKDNSTNETAFVIERCAGRGCTSFVEVARTGAGAVAWIDTGLLRRQVYTYRVRAIGTSGSSAPTAPAAVKIR
jgi:hypothetical protein